MSVVSIVAMSVFKERLNEQESVTASPDISLGEVGNGKLRQCRAPVLLGTIIDQNKLLYH